MKAYGGEFAIVGDNGAGKSTLIKILSGVLKPDCGIIRLEGKGIRKASPKKGVRSPGFLPFIRIWLLAMADGLAANLFLEMRGPGRVPTEEGW